jgi:hypothetical protein
MGHADPAEGAIATGIHNMKGQILITETLGLLHDSSPKYLLGTYAMGAPLPVFNITGKILPDHLGNDRVAVKECADSFKLLGPWVVYGSDHQGHLIVLFLAHFGAAPFFGLVVVFGKDNQFITTR